MSGRQRNAMGPSDDPESRLRRSWEVNAGPWSRAVRAGGIESRRVATDRAVVAAVTRRSPGRVLDVGCGEGWLCRALAERGIDAVGVDGSAALVEAARAAGGGRFEVMSFEELAADPGRAGGPYEVVVCNFALLHEALDTLVSGLRSRLAPGGALVVQTAHPWRSRGDGPYTDGWREERFDGFGDSFPEPMPWYYRTLGSWLGVLRRCGLVLEALEEPVHPESGDPLSLLLVAVPADAGPAGVGAGVDP